MPTTLTGLVIFIALLAPGFIFVVVTERGPFTRTSPSVLRETANIALVSLACDLVAVLLFAGLRAIGVGRLSSLAEITARGPKGWSNDGQALAGALGILLAACLIALIFAATFNQTNGFASLESRRPLSWIIPSHGARTESAWWLVLRRLHPDRYRRVTCYLIDGSEVRGWLTTFNPEVTESEDRELVLAAPIRITSAEGAVSRFATGHVTISARQLRFLHVDYFESTG